MPLIICVKGDSDRLINQLYLFIDSAKRIWLFDTQSEGVAPLGFVSERSAAIFENSFLGGNHE
ncbi:hypothetical protein C1J03_18365 [Sulfitobacter sp. SK012]|nr:hypothetical protein C1J03_18365 [Sulfitobacter sp. SK012]